MVSLADNADSPTRSPVLQSMQSDEETHTMDDATRTELEAATFRRLRDHLRSRTDIQNIDLMILASFCRNCLSKWYRAAAEEKGIEMSYEDAREIVYGMPYGEWKSQYQTEATPEQQAAYAEERAKHGDD